MSRAGIAVLALLAACKFPKPPPVDQPDGAQAQRFTLTVVTDGPGVVSSDPAGVSCSGNTCTATFDAGTQVQLTATADGNAVFVGFTGACSGSIASCAVAMTADEMVSASFEANDCVANTVSCSGNVLNTCDASGKSHPTTCPLGCYTDGTRCYGMVPSNAGMQQCLDDAANDIDISITDGASINTDTGVITAMGGGTIAMPSETIAAPANGVAVRCFHGNNITIGNATVVGAAALAIAANGTVTLNGELSVSPTAWGNGAPGMYTATSTCTGAYGTSSEFEVIGGGGGGGFGGPGGNGGEGQVNAAYGGKGGTVDGTPELIPLRGGCWGGVLGATQVPAKNAGGAVQIDSVVAISLTSGGVSANGWGGSSGLCGTECTGGGGSGGGVLLEAPVVAAQAKSHLVANGGGGGGSAPGMPGAISTTNAAGGPSNTAGSIAAGGVGGALTAATAGSMPSNETGLGGGGGGGVGRIRVNTFATFTPDAGAILSPTPTTGVVTRK